jgi:transposase, IS30 family
MARHDLLAGLFDEGVYFAYPGSPWQRGTNENTNGLLRQYFPKRANLRSYTVENLRRVEGLLNNRPRKTLGWATPAAAFSARLSR